MNGREFWKVIVRDEILKQKQQTVFVFAHNACEAETKALKVANETFAKNWEKPFVSEAAFEAYIH